MLSSPHVHPGTFQFAVEVLVGMVECEEVTFRGFLIEVSDTCSERLNRAEETDHMSCSICSYAKRKKRIPTSLDFDLMVASSWDFL